MHALPSSRFGLGLLALVVLSLAACAPAFACCVRVSRVCFAVQL